MTRAVCPAEIGYPCLVLVTRDDKRSHRPLLAAGEAEVHVPERGIVTYRVTESHEHEDEPGDHKAKYKGRSRAISEMDSRQVQDGCTARYAERS